MRLREIQHILATKKPALQPQIENAPNGLRFIGIDTVRRAVNALTKIDAIAPFLTQLLTDVTLQEAQSNVIIPHGEATALVNQLNVARGACDIALSIVNQLLPKQDPLTVVIEIPQPDDINDLKSIIDDIDMVFSTLTGNRFGRTMVQNFDTGSFWIEAVPASVQALALFVSVANATLLYVHYTIKLATDLKREQALGLVAEELEVSNKHKAKLRDKMLERLATDVAEKHFSEKTHEDVNLLMRTIEREHKLFERGVKLFPANNVPPDIRKEFPDFMSNQLEAAKQELLGASSMEKALPAKPGKAEDPKP